MLKLFAALKRDKIWDFHGGIHPPEMKTQSSGTPLRQLPLPARFVMPLKQHIGSEGELCVAVGDRVLRGQPLTRGRGRMLPVHAPTSGTVTAIAPHATAHPSALAELSVMIDADGEDRWIDRDGWADYRQRDRHALIARLHAFGVAGLGGAGFPTATKLAGGGDSINTLIINAAECEPYITADDRLMQDCAGEIIDGIRILTHILQPQQVLIGIEDNKPQAIAALRAALAHEPAIALRVIPTKYPSGGAKQLTEILTGKQVPHGGRSSDIGVLMQNVGTAWAVKRAVIDGEPLTERVVTLTGEAVRQPGNVWARLGTPVRHLLDHAGFTPGNAQLVIMGGPLMGFTLPWLDVPVVKITNCLLAPSSAEMGEPQPEQGCIRCSACADACPADLLPQQLYWFSKGQQHDKAMAHHLPDCIECGACAWVCPSAIPLVQYFRQQKAEIRAIADEERRAAEAKARFEARQLRLAREKEARQAKHQQAAVQPSTADKAAVDAALARVRDRRDAQTINVIPGATPDNSAMIAAREARKAQARIRQAEQAQREISAEASVPSIDALTPTPSSAVDAASFASRASAHLASAAADSASQPSSDNNASAIDPRKAAVEAAIVRAKARKAAQAADASHSGSSNTSSKSVSVNSSNSNSDYNSNDNNAALSTHASASASATDIASPLSSDNESPAIDPRKAAVEAAIARAKARKAAQAADADSSYTSRESGSGSDNASNGNNAALSTHPSTSASAAADSDSPLSSDNESPAIDPRKAAVEAAIARAKARKAAQAADADSSNTSRVSGSVNSSDSNSDYNSNGNNAALSTHPSASVSAAADSDSPLSSYNKSPAIDPRKAAVEAAIARAKARKAAQAADADSSNTSHESGSDSGSGNVRHSNNVNNATSPAHVFVAAAATSADALSPCSAVNAPTVDSRKTASEPPAHRDSHNLNASDPRKAAVAAAIARVQARKAAQNVVNEE